MKKGNYDIHFLKELAKEFGGDCLSSTFTRMSDKYKWICKNGHTWEAKAQNVKSLKRWCPKCGLINSGLNRRKFSIDDLISLAEAREGKCLSTKFIGVEKKYKWQCKVGHYWEASFHKVKNAHSWCPVCSLLLRAKNRIKYNIIDLKAIAAEYKGDCLSEKFITIKSKYEWQCKKGHIWWATADNVINNRHWCPTCAGNQVGTIEQMQNIGIERGGLCLSKEYKNRHTKLLWKCGEGHTWAATPSSIIRGSWCIKCSEHIGERICREFFEQLFNTTFEKARPRWLKTHEDNWMELDGYSETLHIAFEHQGLQHYKQIKHFHSSIPDKLNKTIERDNLKLKLCKINNVILIQIPSILDILGIENVKKYLKTELINNNVPIPSNFDQKEVDLGGVYNPNKLKELKEIAQQKGGELISTEYHGIFAPLIWRCHKGHEWKAAANNVKNSNSWCPLCAGKYKSIIEMHDLANRFGGKCLSPAYINNSTHLLWECKEGHHFKAKPANVHSGHWCPKCGRLKASLSRRKYSMLDMQEIAKRHNGYCISTDYLGYKSKLIWECNKKHQWTATPEAVLRNNFWCKKCKSGKNAAPNANNSIN